MKPARVDSPSENTVTPLLMHAAADAGVSESSQHVEGQHAADLTEFLGTLMPS